MFRRWIGAATHTLRNLKHLPETVRMAIELVEAQEDAANGNYLEAKRRLLLIYGIAPPNTVERSPTNLLMALVCLRLGNPQAAADLAPTAIAHVSSLRAAANPAERAYLRYAGRVIYEEATRQLGQPKSLNVGVEYEDLDIQKVGSGFRRLYPVTRPHVTNATTYH